MAQCSELGTYRALYGPSVLLKMNIVSGAAALPRAASSPAAAARKSGSVYAFKIEADTYSRLTILVRNNGSNSLQMYYLPSIPLLAVSSAVDEPLDNYFGALAVCCLLPCCFICRGTSAFSDRG